MKLSEAVVKRIKELQKERNMTQYEIFKKSGVPQSTISTVLTTARISSSILTVAQIATAFDMGLKEFFDSDLFTYENLEID